MKCEKSTGSARAGGKCTRPARSAKRLAGNTKRQQEAQGPEGSTKSQWEARGAGTPAGKESGAQLCHIAPALPRSLARPIPLRLTYSLRSTHLPRPLYSPPRPARSLQAHPCAVSFGIPDFASPQSALFAASGAFCRQARRRHPSPQPCLRFLKKAAQILSPFPLDMCGGLFYNGCRPTSRSERRRDGFRCAAAFL